MVTSDPTDQAHQPPAADQHPNPASHYDALAPNGRSAPSQYRRALRSPASARHWAPPLNLSQAHHLHLMNPPFDRMHHATEMRPRHERDGVHALDHDQASQRPRLEAVVHRETVQDAPPTASERCSTAHSLMRFSSVPTDPRYGNSAETCMPRDHSTQRPKPTPTRIAHQVRPCGKRFE